VIIGGAYPRRLTRTGPARRRPWRDGVQAGVADLDPAVDQVAGDPERRGLIQRSIDAGLRAAAI
jgi:hypothetical protein